MYANNVGVERWRQIIIGKLREQEIIDLSDSEVKRAFSGCVANKRLAQTAVILRDSGKLKMEDIKHDDK